MATHSSILAWKIPQTEEPGGLLSIRSHRVGHYWSDLECMHALEKEMAIHSSVLAWRIPGTEEPGGLPSMRSQRVGHDWRDLATAAAKEDWFKEVMEMYTHSFKTLPIHPDPNRLSHFMLGRGWWGQAGIWPDFVNRSDIRVPATMRSKAITTPGKVANIISSLKLSEY